MEDTSYTVGLVLDPDFGEKLLPLAARMHVWIRDSLPNRTAADEIRSKETAPSLTSGVTTFRTSLNETLIDQCSAILDTIDLHHGQHSRGTRQFALEVIGLPFSDEARKLFEVHGFSNFEETPSGFKTRKIE